MNPGLPTAEVVLALTLIIRGLVDYPENVVVSARVDAWGHVVFAIQVDASDVGKVVGKGGRHAHAMRTLVGSMGKTSKQTYDLDIVESLDLATLPNGRSNAGTRGRR